MLGELSQGRSCGRAARGGRASVCRVEFSYPGKAAVETDRTEDGSASGSSGRATHSKHALHKVTPTA